MDLTFWTGIAVGAILAVPAGVLAIWLHGRIVQYLDSRKITSNEKRKKQALRQYKIIEDLRTGRRDKYIYMLRLAMSTIATWVTASVFVSGAFVIIVNIPNSNEPTDLYFYGYLFRHLGALSLLFLSTIGLFLTALSLRRFREINNALEDFEAYEKELKSRWGNFEALNIEHNKN